MSRDLTQLATAELQAEYDAHASKIRELRELQAPLVEELSKRSNKLAFIRNAIMQGQKAVLLAAGVSAGDVAEGELWVADERARAKAMRESQEVSS